MIGDHCIGTKIAFFFVFFLGTLLPNFNVNDIRPPLEQFCTPALELWRTPPLSPRSQFEHLMVDRGRKKCVSEILLF